MLALPLPVLLLAMLLLLLRVRLQSLQDAFYTALPKMGACRK